MTWAKNSCARVSKLVMAPGPCLEEVGPRVEALRPVVLAGRRCRGRAAGVGGGRAAAAIALVVEEEGGGAERSGLVLLGLSHEAVDPRKLKANGVLA